MPAATTRTTAASSLSVPAAFVLANAASYALLLAAAHTLSKSAYGALASLLGVLLIATVPQLAVQTVVGRRVAVGAADPAGLVRTTAVLGLGASAVLLVLTPALTAFLHLHSALALVFTALTPAPMTALGAAMGMAQGARRFRRLAALILLGTGLRSGGALIALLAFRTPDATMAGALVGAVLAVLPALHWHPNASLVNVRTRRAWDGAVAEALHAAHGHGAFLLLTSLDVLLARHVLPAADAGSYAVGAVVTRAALWLPQSVVLLLFASLAERQRHRTAALRALGWIAAMGIVAVAGCAALGRLVVTVVGGAKYHALDAQVWRFALLGTLLAVLQLGLLAGLAQRRIGRVVCVWLTVIADVSIVVAIGGDIGVTGLVTTLAAVTAVGSALSLALTLRVSADDQPEIAAGQAGAT